MYWSRCFSHISALIKRFLYKDETDWIWTLSTHEIIIYLRPLWNWDLENWCGRFSTGHRLTDSWALSVVLSNTAITQRFTTLTWLKLHNYFSLSARIKLAPCALLLGAWCPPGQDPAAELPSSWSLLLSHPASLWAAAAAGAVGPSALRAVWKWSTVIPRG